MPGPEDLPLRLLRLRQIHGESRRACGAPGITAALRRKGRRINRKKAGRLMREHGIRGITRRKRRSLTKADTKAAPSPDLAGRNFTAAGPGTKLVSGITCLPALAGWRYLATVTGLATREVTGYAMAGHHRAELVTDALKMAAGRGALKEGCIAHSDRGPEIHIPRPHPRSVTTRCPGSGGNFQGRVVSVSAGHATR